MDPLIDAYFNWPGFFAGLGALLQVTHVPPVTLALVAPALNGLLWMLGVCLVVRALTSRQHHIWLAAWLFTLFNWIDQDYLSPQAFAYFGYLVVAGLLLHTLAARPAIRGGGAPAVQRIALDGYVQAVETGEMTDVDKPALRRRDPVDGWRRENQNSRAAPDQRARCGGAL